MKGCGIINNVSTGGAGYVKGSGSRLPNPIASSDANKISQSMYPNTTVGFSSAKSLSGAYGNSGIGAGAPNAGKPTTGQRLLSRLKGSGLDDIGIVSGLYDDGHSSRGSSARQSLEYKDADWSAYYGMDASTAYAEAMQNTSYQRTVKDMQRAGLNPAVMFGNGANTNTAFYMGSPASSGGGGGGGGSGYSSARSASSGASGQLFSKDAYSTIAEVSGVAAAAITKRPYNYNSGKAIAQGVMRVANTLSKAFRKR